VKEQQLFDVDHLLILMGIPMNVEEVYVTYREYLGIGV
jgi:hypothetical protein